MTVRARQTSTRTLADRLAADLCSRAAAAGLPRIFLPVGEALQAAALQHIATHGAAMPPELRALWDRLAVQLDAAVCEFALTPGAVLASVVLVDSPACSVLGELDDLTTAGTVPMLDDDGAPIDAEPEHVLQGRSIPRALPDDTDGAARSDTTRELLAQRRTRRTLRGPT